MDLAFRLYGCILSVYLPFSSMHLQVLIAPIISHLRMVSALLCLSSGSCWRQWPTFRSLPSAVTRPTRANGAMQVRELDDSMTTELCAAALAGDAFVNQQSSGG